MVDWEQLQTEVGQWAEKNFGGQPRVNPFLGTAEERSELVERLMNYRSLLARSARSLRTGT